MNQTNKKDTTIYTTTNSSGKLIRYTKNGDIIRGYLHFVLFGFVYPTCCPETTAEQIRDLVLSENKRSPYFVSELFDRAFSRNYFPTVENYIEFEQKIRITIPFSKEPEKTYIVEREDGYNVIMPCPRHIRERGGKDIIVAMVTYY